MTYEEVIENQLTLQSNVLNELCDVRDKLEDNSVEGKIFQGLIDVLVPFRENLNSDFDVAKIHAKALDLAFDED